MTWRLSSSVVPFGAAISVAQVLAFEQLHGHEDEPLLLSEVVYGDDVGMGEEGRRLGLALEALLRLVVARPGSPPWS